MSEQIRSKTIAQKAGDPVPSILRLPLVKARTGLARSTIYLRISEHTFPKPIALGARAVGWISSEIDSWVASRIEASRGGAA